MEIRTKQRTFARKGLDCNRASSASSIIVSREFSAHSWPSRVAFVFLVTIECISGSNAFPSVCILPVFDEG